ncbi:uncharacterized protein LOC114878588 [Osmia bicornis bicornis]|uniref:uncharacterized protein LOC114878588 n=1 Tax=Osmia bicornis bicornis TaxID=1437191 RepID=UPI001EAF1878|nr:uncharacterized protein LOC114878588 [Osmia bicornis bicornis]
MSKQQVNSSVATQQNEQGDESEAENSGTDTMNNTIVAKNRMEETPGANAREELSEEMIDKMKVSQLRDELQRRNSPTAGKKAELRRRFIKSLQDDEESDEELDAITAESENDSSEEEDKQVGKREMHRCKRTMKERNERVDVRSGGSPCQVTSAFTIKDVEGSLCYFTGDDKLPIKKWVSDFEDMNELLSWNDLQKFMYGKRMLKGSAKKIVAFEKGITTWEKLKRRLIREFHVRKNNAEVHAQLYRRRKLPNESNGIPDHNESNKASRSLRALKKKS